MAGTRKRRKQKGRSPIGWFIGGIALGLVGAVVLYTRGFIPAMPESETPAPQASASADAPIIDTEAEERSERYDFFTVLPEMDVVVPDRELSDKAEPQDSAAATAGTRERFILQAGSFRNAADADQMKAQLALLGSVANIQQVNVDGQTWHRVRLGPVEGARAADELRRKLEGNGVPVLVLKAGS